MSGIGLCTFKAAAEPLLLEVLRKRLHQEPPEPRRVPSVDVSAGTDHVGEIDMRTFVAGETKIDVIAHIRQEDLELDRLVLSRFEGSETIANAAFQTLVERYGGRPLAEYALAPQEISTNRIPACLLSDAPALLVTPFVCLE